MIPKKKGRHSNSMIGRRHSIHRGFFNRSKMQLRVTKPRACEHYADHLKNTVSSRAAGCIDSKQLGTKHMNLSEEFGKDYKKHTGELKTKIHVHNLYLSAFIHKYILRSTYVGRPTAHERARARATSDTVPLGYRGGGATAHGGARARAPLGTILLSYRAGGAPTSFTSPAHGAPPSAPLR